MKSIREISLFFTVLLVLFISNSYSQVKSFNFSVGHGSFAPHKNAVAHLKEGMSQIYEIEFANKLNKHVSHRFYKNPTVGLTLQLNQTGNPSLLGYGWSLNGFGRLNWGRAETSPHFYIAFGWGRMTRKYNQVDNAINNAIGSNNNVHFDIRIEKTLFDLFERPLSMALGISHFSNAAMQKPNLGLNFLHLIASYRISEWKHSKSVPELYGEKWNFKETPLNIYYSIGLKESTLNPDYYNFTNTIRLGYDHRFNAKRSLVGSLDLFHNQDIKELSGRGFQAGIHVACLQNFRYAKMSIGLGTYLFNAPDFNNSRFYTRISFEHKISGPLWVNVNVKTHFAVADYSSIGLSYKL